jgi:hypothetical protein
MASLADKHALFDAIGPDGQGAADREIVACCRGPICAYAHEAVRRLRAEGRSARRLEAAWPEWRLGEARLATPAAATDAGGKP